MKNLEILLNRNCNFNCEYCHIVDNSIKENSQSLSTIKRLLTIHNFESVFILGGEPTLNINFLEIIQEINKYPIHLNIYSNGTVSKKILEQIKDFNIKFILSFHSSQMSIKDFIIKAGYIKRFFDISIVIMGTQKDKEIMNNYKKILKIFHGIDISIEPVFDISQEKMDKQLFFEYQQTEMIKYSKILNQVNTNLNMTFLEMFTKKIDEQIKTCEISNHNISYDFQKDKISKCLTYVLNNNFNSFDNKCEYKYCLCDMEYIKLKGD